jgi:hypothetical protein
VRQGRYQQSRCWIAPDGLAIAISPQRFFVSAETNGRTQRCGDVTWIISALPLRAAGRAEVGGGALEYESVAARSVFSR